MTPMAHIPSTFAVIMAGGIGSRFWPMSRSEEPKQFLDILGTGRSLIRMTFDRLEKLVPADHILVVTNARYKDQVAQHLPRLPEENILCEPFMRNTAPCIAYANAVVAARDPEAAMVVAPSDHLILDESGFLDVCTTALETTRNTDSLVTLGIQPTRPDTGYGYIQHEEPHDAERAEVRPVKTFTEKPDLETAQAFLASGDFCWNSGIFVWSLRNIQRAFEDHLPDMLHDFAEMDLHDSQALSAVYGNCENISIDYGIMEKASNVQVVLCDIGLVRPGHLGQLERKTVQGRPRERRGQRGAARGGRHPELGGGQCLRGWPQIRGAQRAARLHRGRHPTRLVGVPGIGRAMGQDPGGRIEARKRGAVGVSLSGVPPCLLAPPTRHTPPL